MTIPGEPLIYSVKYRPGKSWRNALQFACKANAGIMKSCFNTYIRTPTPLVLLIRFYVSPFENKKVPAADVRSEKVPALHAFEICDYLLAFMEMLLHVLINSYKQFVKIDAEKYYSKNPRTVFKFMKWTDYVKLYCNDTDNSAPKSSRKNGKGKDLQPKQARNECHQGICQETRQATGFAAGSIDCDCPLHIALSPVSEEPGETPSSSALGAS